MAPLKAVILFFLFLTFAVILNSCSDNTTSTGSLQVDGQVVDNSGYGVSSALVSINNSEPVHVAQDGKFSIVPSGSPYNILIFNTSDSVVTEYQQLSSPTPVLQIHTPQNIFRSNPIASIEVKHPKSTSGKLMVFALAWGFNPIQFKGVSIYDDTVFNCGLTWPAGISSTTGYFVVFAGDTLNGNFTSYTGYGAKQFTVSEGSTVHLEFKPEDLSFVPPQQFVQVTPPQNSSTIVLDAAVEFDVSFTWGIQLSTQNTNQSVNVLVPTSLSLIHNISFTASDMTYRRGSKQTVQPGTNAQLTFGTDVSLNQPLNGATGVNEQTPFTVDAGPANCLYSFSVYDSSWFASMKTEVFTTGTTMQIPNMARFGTGLVQNRNYMWSVTRLEGYGSMNDFASWNSLKSIRGNRMWNYSDIRTFRYGQ